MSVYRFSGDSDDSSDDSEVDMRLRPTSTSSLSTVMNRTTKSSLSESNTNGLNLTNNHKANNLNTNHNVYKTSNTFDERDNTPR